MVKQARNSKRKSAPETSLPKPAKKPRAESATAISREDLLKRLSQKETQHAKDLYTIITKEDVNTAQWSRNTALTILVESQDVKLKDLQQKLIDKDLAISRLSNQVADYRILVEELRERIAILEGQNKIGEVSGEGLLRKPSRDIGACILTSLPGCAGRNILQVTG